MLEESIVKRSKRARPSSSTSSNGNSSLTSTEEDEDMAKCLILLARGNSPPPPPPETTVYECKTCNRTFPSFQALGGHRASHKKPKTDHTPPDQYHQGRKDFAISPNKPKMHQCSICASQFGSGQALGGHMRRHRPATATRNMLALDLNLPAPPEDEKLPPHVVFSAAALVDCHY